MNADTTAMNQLMKCDGMACFTTINNSVEYNIFILKLHLKNNMLNESQSWYDK